MNLSHSDFTDFHRAVHDEHEPFSWQSRLLEQIDKERQWPKTLDLPTGAGKTTCVDIALFALALDAQRPKCERWCPRRIAMVVDRRVVVDQVAVRGHLLASKLRKPENPVLQRVAELLAELSTSDVEKAKQDDEQGPLGVFTLRGGMPKDDGWARTPNQPLILASTVDQIGSRMLIQGYGVSRSMRPVHAGLLSNDLLLLLDEVHLSQPFQQFLEQLQRLRQKFGAFRTRFQVAALSATPGKVDEEAFRLLEAEKAPESPLGPRLHVSKRAEFREVDSRQELEKECVAQAARLVGEHRTLAVVVNRVASAMAVAKALGESLKDSCDVVPLTGRMRPLDRDEVMKDLRGRIKSGHEQTAGKPLIVVGTQCIEAGADFDFNAMVTECASLDALRQRFGRVDRLGKYKKSASVILCDKTAKKTDPIYCEALARTAEYLKKSQKKLDFGILALRLPDNLQEYLAPKKDAPVLLPAYLDLWMQTSPAPAVVPDVSLWLHGEKSGPADAQVIWREGFEEADLRRAANDPDAEKRLVAWVASIRPSSLESISLPLHVVRRWLQGFATGDFTDAEGGPPPEYDERGTRGLALRWDGDSSKVVQAAAIGPGDTVVVPCSRGGLRNSCFDESGNVPVRDLAEQASFFARGVPTLRLDGSLSKQLGVPEGIEDIGEITAAIQAASDRQDLPDWQESWLKKLGKAKTLLTVIAPNGQGHYVLRGKRVPPKDLVVLRDQFLAEAGLETTTDGEDSVFVGRAVRLSEHSSDVEARAREYAGALGLPDDIVHDIALAGWLHDIGKADPRFQIMLRGGDEIDLYKNPAPLAKSKMEPEDQAGRERARVKSGYPKGSRHEALSLAMIEKHEGVRKLAKDRELVLYLVASHHGYCRPFLPVAVDDADVSVLLAKHVSKSLGSMDFGPLATKHDLHRLDRGLADRFWSLVAKYGWLELCWLEAVLRLADHRASEEEQERDGEDE
jgi:CRISPR-associated endonuclease/helicase Cas3